MYSKIGGVEILLSCIQKHIDESDHARIGHLKTLFRRLTDLSLWSYGLRRVILKIESMSVTFSPDVQWRIGLEIQRILESHIENWLSIWGLQVYNLLDIVSPVGYDAASPYLKLFNFEWFIQRKDRFLPAAKRGYSAALRTCNAGVVEKLEQFFPWQLATTVPYHIAFSAKQMVHTK